MKKHLISFAKAPLGYIFNFLAHFRIFNNSCFIANCCETFCLRDGVQDEVWF
jgi:hypothetical protein